MILTQQKWINACFLCKQSNGFGLVIGSQGIEEVDIDSGLYSGITSGLFGAGESAFPLTLVELFLKVDRKLTSDQQCRIIASLGVSNA